MKLYVSQNTGALVKSLEFPSVIDILVSKRGDTPAREIVFGPDFGRPVEIDLTVPITGIRYGLKLQNDFPGDYIVSNWNGSAFAWSKTGGSTYADAVTIGPRTVTDAVTVSADATFSSASAAFTGADVGRAISGTGIPAGATIASVTSGTVIEMSAAATASATGVTATVGGSKAFTSATAAFDGTDAGRAISGAGIPAGTTIASVESSTGVTLSAAATASATGVTIVIAGRTPAYVVSPGYNNTSLNDAFVDGTIAARAATEAARYALTGLALGTIIAQEDNATYWTVIDAAKLDEAAGWRPATQKPYLDLDGEIEIQQGDGITSTLTFTERIYNDVNKGTEGVPVAANPSYPLPAAIELTARKGQPDGYAGLDGTGKVPAAQLPSYVDDIVEAANFAALPGTGETGKIYVALDTGATYRWSGSAYVAVSNIDQTARDAAAAAIPKTDIDTDAAFAANSNVKVPSQKAVKTALAALPAGWSLPKFSASRATDQVITTATSTKVQFDTEDWDVGACYDPATNFRFTPNVAGYYRISASIYWAAGGASASNALYLYKNGAQFRRFADAAVPASATMQNGTALVYANGSTDYFEIYCRQGSGADRSITGSSLLNYFQANYVP